VERSLPQPVAEAYRILQMNLEALRPERPLQALLLAPASPGEAADAVAAHLAVAFTEAGRQTLVVDADFERSGLHRRFGLSPASGLAALIGEGSRSIDASLMATGIPGLWLLPAGAAEPPPGALTAQRAGELVQALRQRAERILICAPAPQRSSRTLALAEHCDGALLVVRARRTHRADLLRAREALERIHAPLLGVILWR